MGNWDEFTPRRAAPEPAHATTPDFDEICARALTSPAGREFLEALRRHYIDRSENPQAPEAMIRVRVTQQQFVRDLEIARDRGIAAQKRASEAAKTTV